MARSRLRVAPTCGGVVIGVDVGVGLGSVLCTGNGVALGVVDHLTALLECDGGCNLTALLECVGGCIQEGALVVAELAPLLGGALLVPGPEAWSDGGGEVETQNTESIPHIVVGRRILLRQLWHKGCDMPKGSSDHTDNQGGHGGGPSSP